MSINISDITASERSFQINPHDSKLNLKNGDLIRATVVRRLPEGGMVLSTGGKQINVPNGPDLPEGSRHLFQVSITGSKIELRLIEEPASKTPQTTFTASSSNATRGTLSGALTELKGALEQAGQNRASAQGLNSLRQIMPMIVYSDPKAGSAAWIKENIISGGLFWEGKVADILSDEKSNSVKRLIKGDLKGILLSLQKGILSEGDDSNDSLMVKIKQALNLIEGNQQLSLSALEQGMGWLFFIPGFTEDGFLGAEIFSRKRDEKGGLFFSVLLEFTKLGRLQANVGMMESGTSVRILMDDVKKAKLVNENLQLLEKGISALGIKNLTVSCDVRRGEETIEEMMPDIRRRKPGVSILV
jgi:hypothetical protein